MRYALRIFLQGDRCSDPYSCIACLQLVFSVGLLQACFIVQADDVTNIQHAAVAHFYTVTVYNFV